MSDMSSAIDAALGAFGALETFGASVEVGFSSTGSGEASAFLRGVRAFLGADGSIGARGILKWVWIGRAGLGSAIEGANAVPNGDITGGKTGQHRGLCCHLRFVKVLLN